MPDVTLDQMSGVVEPEVTRPRPGAVKADAKFGFAQPAFARGFSEACTAARENGVATLAVAHAHTCTSLGFFTEQFAAAGLIAIGMTNASPVVAPPGGNAKTIGTNPIAMSVPGENGGVAMHFDFSTSAVALGKITMAKAAGDTIPLGWAVDASGAPTTDPEAALGGALVSAGGYKGWGFGLMVELLAACPRRRKDAGGSTSRDGCRAGARRAVGQRDRAGLTCRKLGQENAQPHNRDPAAAHQSERGLRCPEQPKMINGSR